MEDFDINYTLSEETNNEVLSAALLAISIHAFKNFPLESGRILSLMKLAAKAIYPERENKAQGAYDYFSSEVFTNASLYLDLLNSFSSFESLKNSLKQKINPSAEISAEEKEDFSVILAAALFGYSSFYSLSSQIWSFFEKDQRNLYVQQSLISELDLSVLFTSEYKNIKSKLLLISGGIPTAYCIVKINDT